MREFIDEPYTTKWLKKRLLQHSGASIVIARRNGCEDVIYFKESANTLLYEFYRQNRLENDENEKLSVIKLAADLIRSDIQELDCDKETYFSFNDLNDSTMVSYVPDVLKCFIRSLIPRRSNPKDIKIAAIGQALTSLQDQTPYSATSCARRRDTPQKWIRICRRIAPCLWLLIQHS